jgi:hypothetical protein
MFSLAVLCTATLLDIDSKVLQDFGREHGPRSGMEAEMSWKQRFDESTRISQEASQVQALSRAD